MAIAAETRERRDELADRDEPLMRERLAGLGSIPSAMLAECTCPEWCEHDHENE